MIEFWGRRGNSSPVLSFSFSLSVSHFFLSLSRLFSLFLLRCSTLLSSVIVFSFVYVPLHGRARKQNGRAKLLPLSLPRKMSRRLSSRKLDALVPCARWSAEFYANFYLMECVIALVVWYKWSVVQLEGRFPRQSFELCAIYFIYI